MVMRSFLRSGATSTGKSIPSAAAVDRQGSVVGHLRGASLRESRAECSPLENKDLGQCHCVAISRALEWAARLRESVAQQPKAVWAQAEDLLDTL